jgi:hypothetical protein
MKKAIIVFSVLVSSMAASAQHVAYGIKGGLNIADFSNDDGVDFNSRTSFHLGGLAHIHIAPHFALQPELVFSGQGAKYSGIEYKMNYVNIPVLLQFMAGGGFRLQTGPQLGILASAKGESGGTTVDIKDQFKTVDLAWSFGAGYLTPVGFGIDARYNLGLSNVADDGGSDVKNNVIQLGVFYQLR